MAKTGAAGSAAYRECKRYFARRIVALGEELEGVRSDLKASLEGSRSAYRKIGKESARLFGNDPLNFFMFAGCILFPFAVLCVLLRLVGTSALVSLLPAIAGGILIAAVAAVKLAKTAKFRKARASFRAACTSSEEQLALQNKLFRVKAIRKKKLKRIYKMLKKDPNMSEAKIRELRAEFDRIAK